MPPPAGLVCTECTGLVLVYQLLLQARLLGPSSGLASQVLHESPLLPGMENVYTQCHTCIVCLYTRTSTWLKDGFSVRISMLT